MLQYQSLRIALAPSAKPDVDEEATSALAQRLGRTLCGHDLTDEEMRRAVPVATCVRGAALGAIYAALGEKYPDARAGAGSAFGAAAWLIGDEILVPVLGLLHGNHTLSGHASALAGHVVFGLTTEAARALTGELLRQSR